MKPPVHDTLLSVSEAAARLSVTVASIYNMVSQRRLGAFRGRPLRIPVSECDRVLAARYQPPSKVWE